MSVLFRLATSSPILNVTEAGHMLSKMTPKDRNRVFEIFQKLKQWVVFYYPNDIPMQYTPKARLDAETDEYEFFKVLEHVFWSDKTLAPIYGRLNYEITTPRLASGAKMVAFYFEVDKKKIEEQQQVHQQLGIKYDPRLIS